MENFKEIAEKCLAGKLSGAFKLASGKLILSDSLKRRSVDSDRVYQYKMDVDGIPFLYTIYGTLFSTRSDLLDIIDFIPDKMVQKTIEIDIPEGKIPVMEQTESGVVITWKEKGLTYKDICFEFPNNSKFIHNYIRDTYVDNPNNQPFYKKVEVLRKLTNIRNYFGKPKHNTYGHALYYTIERGIHTTPALYPSNDQRVIFNTKEQAEQAIKMLGDELKYLFEPW